MNETSEENSAIEASISEYKGIRHFYKKLVEEVKYVLNERLKPSDVRVADISGRAKTPDSLKKKIESKKYKTPLNDITDLAGVRVVCYYESDLAIANEIIRSAFQVHEHIDKNDDLGVDKMGYHGTHFVIPLGSPYSGARYDGSINLSCEIQVRTVLQ
ncbi:MAG: RelA/SpoT domain-containing protein, partial [Pseudomonadales bacterium]|nr:RelA/SpoT domain-containing protein [Pseudomonadales bacterium]